ncbi:insulinase family protein [Anaplasmataceae bacterium AB001_6]|nr:insulinase family protein [Anaplasmataceae bacterium AB001_6]
MFNKLFFVEVLITLIILHTTPIDATDLRVFNIDSNDENVITNLIKGTNYEEKRVRVSLFNCGYSQENESNNGITFLLMKAFENCDTIKWSREKISEITNKHNIEIIYGYGLDDIYFEFIFKDKALFQNIIPELINEIIYDLHLDVERIKKIKEIAKIECQDRNNLLEPINTLMQKIFQEHPYMLKKYGTVETIENLNMQQLDDFLAATHNREKLVITIMSNDISEAEVVKLVDKISKKQNTKKNYSYQHSQIADLEIKENLTNSSEFNIVSDTGKLYYIIPFDRRNEDSDYQFMVILSLIMHSVYQDIPSEISDISLDKKVYSKGTFYLITIDPTREIDIQKIKDRIREIIRNIVKIGINIEKFKETKKYIIQEFLESFSETDHIMSEIANFSRFHRYQNYMDKFIENVSQTTTSNIEKSDSTNLLLYYL